MYCSNSWVNTVENEIYNHQRRNQPYSSLIRARKHVLGGEHHLVLTSRSERFLGEFGQGDTMVDLDISRRVVRSKYLQQLCALIQICLPVLAGAHMVDA